MRWLKRWWPVLVWALVISGFSTNLFTAANTGRIILPVVHWMFPSLSPEALDWIHHVIRKCAHFTEYFILSWLILRGLRGSQKVAKMKWAVLTVVLVFGYAALDEFHQSFVPGRTAAFHDVLIDTSGGIAAQVAAALLVLLAAAREHRKAREAAAALPNADSR